MSDTIDDFRAMKEIRRAMRAKFGVSCPRCAKSRPKAQPTILLPGQRCRVDGYVDPRPDLTDDELSSL